MGVLVVMVAVAVAVVVLVMISTMAVLGKGYDDGKSILLWRLGW